MCVKLVRLLNLLDEVAGKRLHIALRFYNHGGTLHWHSDVFHYQLRTITLVMADSKAEHGLNLRVQSLAPPDFVTSGGTDGEYELLQVALPAGSACYALGPIS